MLELLLTAVFVALSAVALTVIVRNAPVVRTWVFEMKKPWACNVCMPLYACAAVVGALGGLQRDPRVLLTYLPAYLLSNVMLDHMARPPGPPHIPKSMFEDLGEEVVEQPETQAAKGTET